MAFNDEKRRFWHIDLSTRAGAQSAAYQGAIACFIFCGMGVLGLLVFGGLVGLSTFEGLATAFGAGLEAVIALVAGLRLRSGKGAYWGIASAVLTALELIGKVAAFSILGALLTGMVLVMTIQGVRGAFALMRQDGFEDDDIDVFA